jgi:hypothetical protein
MTDWPSNRVNVCWLLFMTSGNVWICGRGPKGWLGCALSHFISQQSEHTVLRGLTWSFVASLLRPLQHPDVLPKAQKGRELKRQGKPREVKALLPDSSSTRKWSLSLSLSLFEIGSC